MNTRTHWRMILGIVALLLAMGVAFTVTVADSPAKRQTGLPGSVTVPIQPVTVMAVTKSGGTVGEVFGRPGDRVTQGALLVRLETAAIATQRRELEGALRETHAALQSSRELAELPAGLRSALLEVRPEVAAAEDRYVRAVAALDRAKDSPKALSEANTEWQRASAERQLVRERLGRSLSAATGATGLAGMIPLLEGRLRDLDRMAAESDVRAPSDGVIDILDLHAGDRLLPGQPAAVLLQPGEYFCEFRVPVGDGAALRVGLESAGTIGDGKESIRWQIESLGRRMIPIGFRENREEAEEMRVRARFRAREAWPGMEAVLELPLLRAAR